MEKKEEKRGGLCRRHLRSRRGSAVEEGAAGTGVRHTKRHKKRNISDLKSKKPYVPGPIDPRRFSDLKSKSKKPSEPWRPIDPRRPIPMTQEALRLVVLRFLPKKVEVAGVPDGRGFHHSDNLPQKEVPGVRSSLLKLKEAHGNHGFVVRPPTSLQVPSSSLGKRLRGYEPCIDAFRSKLRLLEDDHQSMINAYESYEDLEFFRPKRDDDEKDDCEEDESSNNDQVHLSTGG